MAPEDNAIREQEVIDQSTIIDLPPGVPEEARNLLIGVGYFSADVLTTGDKIQPITLSPLHGSAAVTIAHGGRNTARPTVLIFGSYT